MKMTNALSLQALLDTSVTKRLNTLHVAWTWRSQQGGGLIKFSFLCFYHFPGKRGSMKEGLERPHRGGNFRSEFWRMRGASVGKEERKDWGRHFHGDDVDKRQSWHWTSFSNRESQTHGDLGSGISRDGMVDKPALCRQGVWTRILHLPPDGYVTLSIIGFLTCKGIPSDHTSKGQVQAIRVP